MNTKIEKLKELLLDRGKIAVAFSGGVDSSALLAFAVDILGAANVLALTVKTAYTFADEFELCKKLAKKMGARFEILEMGISESIMENPHDRCYLCKKSLFVKLKSRAKDLGFSSVADGSNADDLSDWRPGMRALRELEISSPFIECNIDKEDIRKIARCYKLENAELPANACLLTRFPFGEKIDCKKLELVENAEKFLHSIGLGLVRARRANGDAQIELGIDEFEPFMNRRDLSDICDKIKKMGFKNIEFKPYKRGAMNK